MSINPAKRTISRKHLTSELPEPKTYSKLSLIQDMISSDTEFLEMVMTLARKRIETYDQKKINNLLLRQPSLISSFDLINVKNVDKSTLKALLKIDGLQIASLYDPDEELCHVAAENNLYSVYYVKKPSINLIYKAIQKYPCLIQYLVYFTMEYEDRDHLNNQIMHKMCLDDVCEYYPYIPLPDEFVNILYLINKGPMYDYRYKFYTSNEKAFHDLIKEADKYTLENSDVDLMSGYVSEISCDDMPILYIEFFKRFLNKIKPCMRKVFPSNLIEKCYNLLEHSDKVLKKDLLQYLDESKQIKILKKHPQYLPNSIQNKTVIDTIVNMNPFNIKYVTDQNWLIPENVRIEWVKYLPYVYNTEKMIQRDDIQFSYKQIYKHYLNINPNVNFNEI